MMASGTVLGIGVSGLLFLAIPLTQIFTTYQKSPEEIEALEIAPPPPPEDPPPHHPNRSRKNPRPNSTRPRHRFP